MGLLFDRGSTKKKASKPALFSERFKEKPEEPDAAALEAEARAAGAGSFIPTVSQAGGAVIDLLSRPNYAVAAGLSEGPGAAFRELFSGIGGLKGRKRGFGQVMEESGVGQGGNFSDLMPFLYSETGEGPALQKGGALDPTGRGATGLALDIFLDPTTYIGVGAAAKLGKIGKVSKPGLIAYGKAAREALPTIEHALDIAKAPEAVVSAAVEAERAADLARQIVPRGTQEILASGIKVGSEGFAAARKVAYATAEDRLAAAIKAGATEYLSEGGIRWAGVTIPGTPRMATAMSGMSTRMIEKLAEGGAGPHVMEFVAGTRKIKDAIVGAFVKGHRIRNLEGALDLLREHNDATGYLRHLMDDDIGSSPLAKYADMHPDERVKKFKPAIDAYEKGGIGAVDPEMQPAMAYYAKKMADMAAAEQASGVLPHTRQNYFAHFYDNDPEDMLKVVYKFTGKSGKDVASLGRHAEERVFDTLDNAVRYSTALNKNNRSIPILRPNYDPLDVLRRRWEKSIDARMGKELVEKAEARFGPAEFNVSELYDLAPTQKGKMTAAQTKEYLAIQKAVAAGKTDTAWVASLSDDGKREFLRERLLKAKSRPELNSILNKYSSPLGKHDFTEFMPKGLIRDFDFAPDGSVFRKYNFGSAEAILPSSLGDEIMGMDQRIFNTRAARMLADSTDKAMSYWKGSMTAIWPAFHVRNAIANVGQSLLDVGMNAINPVRWLETRRVLRGGEGIFKTKEGIEYSYAELRDLMKRHQVLTRERALFETTGSVKAPIGPGKAFEKGRAFGTKIENDARANLFLNNIRRGLSPPEAGAKVAEFLFDYEHGLTSFERDWMRRLFPFYTWQRLNLGLMGKSLAVRPGMLAAEIKPFRGRDDENEMLTMWDAGALKLRLNRDGKTVKMLTGIDLPIRNLDMLWRGSGQKTLSGLAGMLTPIAKVPIEATTGTEFFTNRPFSRKESEVVGKAIEHLPEPVKNFLGYQAIPDAAGRIRYTFDGQRFNLIFQSWVLSRVISTSDRQFRLYLDPQKWDLGPVMLNVLSGLQLRDLNLDEEKAKRTEQRIRQIQEAEVRRGLKRKFERVYTPKQ